MSRLESTDFNRNESSSANTESDHFWDALSEEDESTKTFSVKSNDNGEWRAELKATEPIKPQKEKITTRTKQKHQFDDENPNRPKRSKDSIWKSLGFALVAAQALTSILLMVSLIATHIISGQYIVLLSAFLLVLLALSAIKLLGQKKVSTPMKVVCGGLSAIMIVVSVFALRYTDAFNGFLNKVTSKDPETKQYSVVVMENSEVKELKELKNKSIGFLKTDEKAGNAENYLLEKVQFEANFYEDVDTLVSVFNGSIVDAITIETDRMEILKEEAEEAIKNTRVIYTFAIEIDAENEEISEKQITKEPFVLYISGSDSRSGVKATARSDVNILAVVNPEQKKILLVSIPRDTYVQLHGTTGIKDKLTHAGVYGINMSRETIEDFLGISIDYTAKVSFDTVVKVVDQLGGIEIDSDQEMSLKAWDTAHPDKTCHYVIGKQEVDGDCALRFARERKSYKTGDRHRGENQMQVISAIVAKLSGSRDYILRLPEILNIAADSFETSFTRDDISAFIRMQLNDGGAWQVESISVDGTGAMQGTYSMGASRPLYVMIPNQESVNNAVTKIREYLSN